MLHVLLWNFFTLININNKVTTKICLNGWNFYQNPSDFVVIEDGSFFSGFNDKLANLQDNNNEINVSNDTNNNKKEEEVKKLKKLEEIKSLEMIFGFNQMNSALAFFNFDTNLISTSTSTFAFESKDKDNSIFELIPIVVKADINKDQRKAIHNSIRIIFDNKVDSKTIIDTNSIQLFKKKERKGGPLARWDASKPDYLEFTLIKSLLSTTDAIDRIAKKSGHLSTRFAAAGSKDRKAITMQRISAWRVSHDELMRINKNSTTLSIRDIKEAHVPQKLGKHQGNVFYITLRPENHNTNYNKNNHNNTNNTNNNTNNNHNNDNNDNEDIESEANEMVQRIIELGHVPYINYFGTQRFGWSVSNSNNGILDLKISTNTIISKLILKGSHYSFMQAVLFLLLSPQGRDELELAKDKFNIEILCRWLQINGNDNGNGEEHIIDIELYLSNLKQFWINYLKEIQELIDNKPFIRQRYDIISRLLLNEHDIIDNSSINSKKTPLIQKKILINIIKQLKSRDKLSSVDWKSAFNSIPQNLRLLYINSYQSQLFNLASTNLCMERGFTPTSTSTSTHILNSAQEGDLVLVGPNQEPLKAWDVSNRNIIMSASNFKNNKNNNNNDNDNDEDNDKKTNMNKAFIHIVTKDEEESKCYPMEAVVLPLPGCSTLPCNYITQLLDHDNENKDQIYDSNLLSGNHPDKLYRLPGAYRHVLTSAKNVHVCFKKKGWKNSISSYNTNHNHNTNTNNTNNDNANNDSTNINKKNLDTFVQEKWDDGSMEVFLSRIHEHDDMKEVDNKKHSLPPILLEQQYLDISWNKNHIKIKDEEDDERDVYGDRDNSNRLEVSFTLCASSYATVWLHTLNLIA